MMEVARGNVPGFSFFNKFGENPEIPSNTEEDLWDAGGIYPFPTTVDITHIKQAVDEVAMRGAMISIQGLDSDWNLVTQFVNLDATDTTTLVALPTPLRRAFRMRVLAGVTAVQNIRATNAGDTVIYAQILTPYNQTRMALLTVPANSRGYLINVFANVVNATGKTPKNTVLEAWSADRANGYTWQLNYEDAIPTEAYAPPHKFSPPITFSEKTDIRLSAIPSDQAGRVFGGFDIIIEDLSITGG